MLSKTVDGVVTNYTYNNNDQLVSQGSSNFTYDDNGNLIAKDSTAYAYDDKNRLVQVTDANNLIQYTYDVNDNRVNKSVNGNNTSYLIDANTQYAQVIQESSATDIINYTYGNDLLSQTGTNGTYTYHTDALGSTRSLTDISSNQTDSFTYTPYGELAHRTGTTQTDFLYTGEQLDRETDNYYLRARYYSPSSSRFMSRDTYDGNASNPITQNHYLYGNANPVMFVDPSGYTSMLSLGAGIAILGKLASAKIRSIGKKVFRSFRKKRKLYRGVNNHNYHYPKARQGRVNGSFMQWRPDILLNNAKSNHNDNETIGSIFSSWTTKRRIAKHFATLDLSTPKATRSHGVIITAYIMSFQIFKSPNRHNIANLGSEAEWLVIGPVQGIAKIVRP